MKKLCLLIALLILVSSVLVACGSSGGETSKEPSSAGQESNGTSQTDSTGGESSGESSEPSQNESSEEEPEVYEYATVVSTGKPYTSTVEPGEAYPDTYNSELTDNLFAPTTGVGYSDSKLVGYAPGSESGVTIVVDLGEVMDKLYEFKVSYLCTSVAGIAAPSSISVYISSDNANWERAGRLTMGKYEEDTMQIATLTLTRSVSARYVKFIVNKNAAWIFLDEVMVVANIPSGQTREDWVEAINKRYGLEELTADQRSAALKAISGSKADRSKYRTNIAKGVAYTTTGTADANHPDSNKMLTDGNISQFLEGKTWVGYTGGKEMEIVINFPSARNNISGFELYAYNNPATGVSFPVAVGISVSSDKTNWTQVGRVYAPTDNRQEIFTYVLELEYEITARYVKFTLAETDCTAFYIEEVKVIAYVDEVENKTLYPALSIPKVTKDEYWPSSDPDYNKTINLIKGLYPQIHHVSKVEEECWSNNTPVTSKLMTDGVYATSNDIHNGFFFKFNRGSHRDVFFDLTKVSAVSEFKASFTHITQWAVYAPDYISVYLSTDGQSWYLAGRIKPDISADPGIAKGTLELETPVAARFICFSFDMATWAGCDELEVIGTKKVDSSVKTLKDSGFNIKDKFMVDKYAAPDENVLGGVEDLYLVYHSTSRKRTQEEFLPLLAYIDANGEMKDILFDGYLFLMSGSLPSGNAGHAAFTKSDCEWLVKTLFEEGYNINALEKAAGQVKQALGLGDGYKYKFYVALYYPKANGFFGDLDGDGKADTLSNLEKRLEAVEYYINLFEAELSKQNFKNIEFYGYYWYDEAASAEENDMVLINGVSDIVHNHGYQLFWIPYYVASGYSLWSEHGFDVAVMQPNYAFGLDRPISSIINTANFAKRFGMGVEIELDGRAINNELFLKRYMQYLEYGVYYGYIGDCINMYYMGFDDFNKAYESKSPKLRLIYEYTYQFIKGTLDINPDALSPVSFTAAKDTPTNSTLNPDRDETMQFKILVSPKHGTVTINSDGTFTYYPDKGYTGADEFTYVYSRYLGDSEPCSVSITVG
jgi:hypothetical protein